MCEALGMLRTIFWRARTWQTLIGDPVLSPQEVGRRPTKCDTTCAPTCLLRISIAVEQWYTEVASQRPANAMPPVGSLIACAPQGSTEQANRVHSVACDGPLDLRQARQ